jgi:hypothetical protein
MFKPDPHRNGRVSWGVVQIVPVILICLALNTGCSGGADDAKPRDSQKNAKDQKPQAVLTAVVCTIGITNKTLCVLPWEKASNEIGDAALLKRDAPRMLAYEADTQLSARLVGETNLITIAQCMQGAPISTDCARLDDLEGELARLQIETVGEREVIRKLEVLGAFDRDTFPLRSGTGIVQVVGGPVKCDAHKAP